MRPRIGIRSRASAPSTATGSPPSASSFSPAGPTATATHTSDRCSGARPVDAQRSESRCQAAVWPLQSQSRRGPCDLGTAWRQVSKGLRGRPSFPPGQKRCHAVGVGRDVDGSPRDPCGGLTEFTPQLAFAAVAAVLAAGSENVAAHRLGLSHSTVEHHLANARSKVEASVLAQASSIRKTGVRGTSARASSNVPVAFSKPM